MIFPSLALNGKYRSDQRQGEQEAESRERQGGLRSSGGEGEGATHAGKLSGVAQGRRKARGTSPSDLE